MNRTETGRLLQQMAERWPNWRLPTEPAHLMSLVATWAADLEHVPLAPAVEAVRAASLDGRDWPPPLGWVVVEGLRRSGVSLPPDADEAWQEVQAQLAHVGRYGSPCWSHPALAEVVGALGGWRQLCASEMVETDRAHFLRLWPAARQRAVVEACTPRRGAEAPPSHELDSRHGGVVYPLPPVDGVAELDAVRPVPGRASREEAAAARTAVRAAMEAAEPRPNRKRARNDP